MYSLYRWFAEDGTLLYIGLTQNFWRRTASHSTDKVWWPDVARCDVVHYGTVEEGALAELNAILNEHPLHNITDIGQLNRTYGMKIARRKGRPPLRDRSVCSKPDCNEPSLSYHCFCRRHYQEHNRIDAKAYYDRHKTDGGGGRDRTCAATG